MGCPRALGEAVRRREFIGLLGGAAVASPLAVGAQQVPVVGYLYSGSPASPLLLAAFHKGLRTTGHIEGQNVTVEYRYGLNQPDRVRDLTADLVRRNVAAIASLGGTLTARIVKAATSTIPIIFEVGYDPVEAGLVASLSRPCGNLTGVNSIIGELWTKRIDLMAKLLPNSRIFGVLMTGPTAAERQSQRVAAADALGLKLVFATALTPLELDAAF